MAMSDDQIRSNFSYWSQWFSAAEAAELAHIGGARSTFYQFKAGGREGTRITGADVLAQQRRFVEGVRATDRRFRSTQFRVERRRGKDGVIRTVRVKNISEAMKRVASRRRDSLVRGRIANATAFRTWLKIHFPNSA